MTPPAMEPERLEALTTLHVGDLTRDPHCPLCEERAPCTVAGLLAEIERLRGEVARLTPKREPRRRLAKNERINRWDEVVTINAAGNCTDCGRPPYRCVDDDHK